jgi:NAD(P)-dependent dehydrogenase (short-subunit alcohol dehydrogenase family)
MASIHPIKVACMHALITGIGRKKGIAAAIARALADGGWELTLTGAPAYDIDSPWSEGSEAEEIVDSLGGVGSRARCCTATAAGVLCAQTEPFLSTVSRSDSRTRKRRVH